MESNEIVDFVLSGFKALLKSDSNQEDIINTPIPIFDSITIFNLCHLAIKVLEKQPSLLQIDPPCVVVGDLHGSFHDLLRIFSIFKQPPTTKYVFLGDYVDRGPFSLEVMTMLIAYQCAFPDHVFLVRGNHEIAKVNSMYGFKSSIIFIYGMDDIWRSYLKVFSWMPLAAVIGGEIFCVHGGISPILKTVDQINQIQRPLPDPNDILTNDLLWSDPSPKVRKYKPSERENGNVFGHKAIKQFLKSSGMKLIIRAHQCVDEGISVFEKAPLITVFSSSCYGKSSENKSGVVVIDENNETTTYSLPPLRKLSRDDILFFPMSKATTRKSSAKIPRAIRSFFSYNQLLSKMTQKDFLLSAGRSESLPQLPKPLPASPLPPGNQAIPTNQPIQAIVPKNRSSSPPPSSHTNQLLSSDLFSSSPQQPSFSLKRSSNSSFFNSALVVFNDCSKKPVDPTKRSSLPILKNT